MTNAKRGRASRRGVYLCAVAALGLALSGCGGGGTSAAGAPAAASSQPADGSVSDQSPTADQSPTTDTSSTSSQDPTSAQGTSSGSSTSPGSGTTAGSGSTGSGSAGSTAPAATAGTVTINWQPPTENVDGSTLTDLAGYDIHYGTTSGHYTQTITVSNPGIAAYVVSNLTPGTYYFAVAAVNAAGTESPLSSEVSATVTN